MYTKDKNCPVDMPHAVKRRAICVALRIALLLVLVGLGLGACGRSEALVSTAKFSF